MCSHILPQLSQQFPSSTARPQAATSPWPCAAGRGPAPAAAAAPGRGAAAGCAHGGGAAEGLGGNVICLLDMVIFASYRYYLLYT